MSHVWGPVEYARMTGNPHLKCQVAGCHLISLDLEDAGHDYFDPPDSYFEPQEEPEEEDDDDWRDYQEREEDDGDV